MQPFYSASATDGYNFGGGYQPPPSSGYTPSDYPPPGNRPSSGGGFSPTAYSQGSVSPKPSITTCANCSATVDVKATFCHICGSTIVGSIAVMEKNADSNQPQSPTQPTPQAPLSNTTAPPSPPKPDNKPRCRNCGTNIKAKDDYCPSCGSNTRFEW